MAFCRHRGCVRPRRHAFVPGVLSQWKSVSARSSAGAAGRRPIAAIRDLTARRVFLLSPANCGGERAQLLFSPNANFDLARRLRTRGGAPLGEVMSFVSGLY